MAEAQSYKMAIDLLRCHLGLTEEEAKLQLGIGQEQSVQQHIAETQQAFAMLGLNKEV
ncbi:MULTISPECIES: hypothetical protein [Vibrio]|jgi:hypothetical protein|uniref:Dethiobiotin synthetase n=2 Tax=Vibrio TaxID=662 RepID=A0A329E0R0_VIBDI|nr:MULTISPECIES: hypothetical protein [Vibrio]MCF7360731.1 hypothetical protein [Vibrio sp. A1-b2]MCZ4371024.1 hypothetical protein [Vibrio diazotrophicus]MDW6017392.1 hypothetical protein [Vibrio plantisponsor]NNM40334.1 hypothetical protein [Vibrio plantisponsor]RAS56459.1 hypothetical protein DET48_14411 [Vibrio diazotrophicus]